MKMITHTESLLGLASEIAESRDNSFQYRLGSWALLTRLVQHFEDENDMDEAGVLATHLELVRLLGSVGHMMVIQGLSEDAFQSEGEREATEARVRWLRDKETIWHREMTGSRRNCLLRDVFGVGA